ncbi:MAG: L-serine ammonia-lyase, iron-sulfur-dependent, subunit alpha, partial [Bacteroidota bacterium]
AGIEMEIVITDIQANHPNTYRIILGNGEEAHTLVAISTGGGMIGVVSIDGSEVSMAGDFHETLVFCKVNSTNPPEDGLYPYAVAQQLKSSFSYDELIWHDGDIPFFEIKSHQAPDPRLFEELNSLEEVLSVKKLWPVLPVLSSKNTKIPFITCQEMLDYNKGRQLELWELAAEYESARGNISKEEVVSKMTDIVHIMQHSIRTGLNGTFYEDRLLGSQSVHFKEQMENNKLVEGNVLNRIIMYVSAIMEVKSSMGVIVAAPTAGSCGALPGAVIGMGESLDLSEAMIVKAMLAAGILGVFISEHATFAAEVGGCQAECGSGACMAAAAIVYLAGGSLAQSLSAASLALQNSLGMICDPIANRVEAPCLGKNVLAASNALSCANMALANYDHLIPLDEVIETMDKVGHSIPHTLRCTTLGGLSITRTAKELEAKLENVSFFKSC